MSGPGPGRLHKTLVKLKSDTLDYTDNTLAPAYTVAFSAASPVRAEGLCAQTRVYTKPCAHAVQKLTEIGPD